jgi:hypothetical protein
LIAPSGFAVIKSVTAVMTGAARAKYILADCQCPQKRRYRVNTDARSFLKSGAANKCAS